MKRSGSFNSLVKKISLAQYFENKVSAVSETSESEDDLNYVTEDDEQPKADFKRTSKRIKNLSELIEPMSSTYLLHKEIKRLEYLTSFVGCSSRRLHYLYRLVGRLLWVVNLLVHFAFDAYEAVIPDKGYGYTFVVAQGIWFVTFIILTWGTAYRTLPWLEDGLRELRREECYEKTVTRMMKIWRKFPYIVIAFGFVASTIQHSLLYFDKALHIDFGLNITSDYKYAFHVLRFVAGMHVYSAYLMFWLIPLSIVLMTGYSMKEYNDQTGAKMRDKEKIFTFKEAISSYSTRANFVKTSSSKNLIVLAVLVATGVLCFGLNAYVFLFGSRLYLHVWHSLLPLAVMIYPLCSTAWTTKQYNSFIIVVVRAWVHRQDLDETSSDEDSGIEDLSSSQTKNKLQLKLSNLQTSKFNFLRKRNSSATESNEQTGTNDFFKNNKTHNNNNAEKNHLSDLPMWQKDVLGDTNTSSNKSTTMSPWQHALNTNENRKTSSDNSPFRTLNMTAAKAAAKFKAAAKRPRFNFEKFLSYLESMRYVVGFEIAGLMMTWDKVSTTLFLMFSIVAVFVQESIFGSKTTTL